MTIYLQQYYARARDERRFSESGRGKYGGEFTLLGRDHPGVVTAAKMRGEGSRKWRAVKARLVGCGTPYGMQWLTCLHTMRTKARTPKCGTCQTSVRCRRLNDFSGCVSTLPGSLSFYRIQAQSPLVTDLPEGLQVSKN